MAFCKSCGQDIGNANFCPKCGASQSAAVAPAPVATSTDGVQENVAGLLCYLPAVGWVIALVFFLIDKRPFVKFHAVQSLAFHVALIVIYAGLGIFLGMLHFIHFFFFGAFLYPVLWLGSFIVLILMMVKAYGHEKYKLPVIGDFAEGLAK
ncbi:MAG TPA: DUF4870 domain-containing protein [Dongiaceae bacterium]|nr:DUF4870 domain-containing protein [Dongiaceae bacterium]